jgi:hypothetical protein
MMGGWPFERPSFWGYGCRVSWLRVSFGGEVSVWVEFGGEAGALAVQDRGFIG